MTWTFLLGHNLAVAAALCDAWMLGYMSYPLAAYAEACASTHPALAADLLNIIAGHGGMTPNDAATLLMLTRPR